MNTSKILRFIAFWFVLIIGIGLLAILLRIFAFPYEVIAIFSVAALIVGLPLILKEYPGTTIKEFWGKIFKGASKGLLVIFLVMLIRAFFAHIISGTIFDSLAVWTKNTATNNIIGYAPEKILFEAVFFVIVGYAAGKAVFGKNRGKTVSWAVISLFLFLSFSVIVYKKARETLLSIPDSPLAQITSYQRDGYVRGALKELKVIVLGKTKTLEVIKIKRGDLTTLTLAEKGLTTPWIEVPEGVIYNIRTANNLPYRVYYSNGTRVDILSGRPTELPDIFPTKFKIVNLGERAETYTISGM